MKWAKLYLSKKPFLNKLVLNTHADAATDFFQPWNCAMSISNKEPLCNDLALHIHADAATDPSLPSL